MDADTGGAGEFGQLLRALRGDAGLSQEELAHAAGISVRALANLERGRTRGPQRHTVQALSAVLEPDPATAERLERAARRGRPRPRTGGPDHPRNTLSLPRDLPDFTARAGALDRLAALARHADPAHPPVAVVSGQPGLGKSAFAVHAAHLLAPRFPDGQFGLDLRGMDPDPLAPRDALARLLRALGVADSAVPRETDGRAGLFRSTVADRRVLLLLDNAADEDQVRPLLPATGRSLTLVTSRRTLAGLEAAGRIDLALLRREESVELLGRIIGTERVEPQAQAARDLADLCGHLPLAVRIAGQRLAARPQERIGKLVAQLAEEERRLDALQAGGLQVRAAFALSHRLLGPDARLLLRRAALAAGPDFSPQTLALLADLPEHRAAVLADELADAGLLRPDPAGDRYRFHDLLKLYATERSTADDTAEERAAALERTHDLTLRRATAAALRFDAEHSATAPADRGRARAWLEAERFQWLAALHHARAAGRHRQVLDTAEAMHWFSDLTHHWDLWVEVFRCSAEAARALEDRPAEATHLNYLAWAQNLCAGDPVAALATAETALAVARGLGDRLQSGWALGYRAGALHWLGRTAEAVASMRAAAVELRGEDSHQGRLAELTVRNGLGTLLRLSGRPDEAEAIHRGSLAICATGLPGQSPETARIYSGISHYYLGNALGALARWPEAEAELRHALADFESAAAHAWDGPARLDLALSLLHQNRHPEARPLLLTARNTLAELDHPRLPEAVTTLHDLDDTTEHPTASRPAP
ncbi:helix-turn-helix domain-containing protein [Kitasatospora cineracea]|uniref:helix-turn-helix domain-containing protein n=1 Tax=Kitasatospora cineracea TaxID=88074 RepID=UPI003823F202